MFLFPMPHDNGDAKVVLEGKEFKYVIEYDYEEEHIHTEILSKEAASKLAAEEIANGSMHPAGIAACKNAGLLLN